MSEELTPDRHAQIEQICQLALDLDATSRAAYLAKTCGDDAELRREVESLLAHERSAQHFIEEPALDAAAKASLTDGRLGECIGPYEIVSLLGTGGMGDVYRARDTQLGRDVAIKVLPAVFLGDPERVARFQREARVLASLNHPHIGAIYGVEQDAAGRLALVLELVEGPTLAERLRESHARSGLPVAEALAIASQIGRALEAAHDMGIVHRDLKPSNITLTANGTAKVLDFGVAKVAGPMDGASDRLGAAEDALSISEVHPDVILGTAAYMSPEQARGATVDKRTDIWAFGCVLFEMLCGQRPFDGKSAADTRARILEREPDWSLLPANTPPSIRTLLQRCLRKNPEQRLHDIADVRIEIDECDLAAPRVPAGTRRARPFTWIAVALVVSSALVAIAFVRLRAPAPSSEFFEFPVDPPENLTFPSGYGGFAVSPDGRHLFVTAASDNGTSVWVRPIGARQYRQIPGTEGALFPFWKPDGLEVGFFAGGKLKTILLSGGLPTVVCDAPDRHEGSGRDEVGGTWNRDDVIVFMSSALTLQKVQARSGATPVAITTLGKGETAHRWPSFLPDGRRFLYLALGRPGDLGDLRIGSLDGAISTSLGRYESNARYAAGHLLFLSGRQLVARRFDASTGVVTGPPLPVVTTPPFSEWNRLGAFSTSDAGVLATHPGGPIVTDQRLTWRDRHGRNVGTVGELGRFPTLDLSPDGKRVAVSMVKGSAASDIWTIDITRGDAVPLTSDPAWEFDPSWSHDGRQLVFNSNRIGGRVDLFLRPSEGSGQDELLVAAQYAAETPVWTPDDRSILYGDDGDLWIRPLDGGRKASILWKTKARERAGTLSPDGRWVAYTSDKSGRQEIYVRAFPYGDAEHKVSLDGGMAARWRADGKEIFFLSLDAAMMAARVETAQGFKTMIPKSLFSTGLSLLTLRPYAVAPDGRFLVPTAVDSRAGTPITVTLNWLAGLPR